MNNIYFFKNDRECKWMQKEIKENLPKFLHEAISFEEINDKLKKKMIIKYPGKIKFYLILDWIQRKSKKTNEAIRGGNPQWLDELKINYVQSVKDLPDDSGIYITGYDADIEEVEEINRKGIPVIYNACPWVSKIKNQLYNVDSKKNQCIFMIDKGHMVYDCYKSIIPEDTIIINPENYQEEIKNNYINKPLCLIVYSSFRKKEAERVVNYINTNFPDKNNILNGYKETLCCWTKQGLIEEISDAVKKLKLNEVWVICSSENDRSTKSILNEIKENNVNSVIIKKESDIPAIFPNYNFGVLIAPIPISSKVKNIVNIIKMKADN